MPFNMSQRGKINILSFERFLFGKIEVHINKFEMQLKNNNKYLFFLMFLFSKNMMKAVIPRPILFKTQWK